MKSRESLKNYVNYFQSQMALICNCNKDVADASFSRMQVTNPFYKHLMKNNVTKMRDILTWVQKYIQIEGATRATSSRPLRQGPEVEKPKPQFTSRKNLSYNFSTVHKPSRHATESSKGNEVELDLIPFRVPIDHIFNAIKDQLWVRRPTRPLPPNLKRHGSRDYYAFYEGRGHLTVDC